MSAKKSAKLSDCRETPSELLVDQELGNAQTTCIIEELNSIYEGRLQDIDNEAKGDSKNNFSQLKCITYKEWVDMLMRTMRHMLQTLEVLENQASKRINLLERKLQIECTIDHSTDTAKLKCDLANLLELIRRAVEDKKWNTDGLEFKTITMYDIFRDPINKCNNVEREDVQKLNSQIICQNQTIKRLESERNLLKTELGMKDLELKKLNSACCTKCKTPVIDICTKPTTEEDAVFKACISELKKEMREKECKLADTLQENECLKSELTLVKSQVIQKDKNCTCSKRTTSPRTRSTSPDKSGTYKVFSSRTGTTMSQSECSDYTLDTVVALESQKLQSCQVEENQRIQMLQKELDELFCIQSTREGNVEENRRMVTCQQKKVQELIQKLLCDLYASRNKLAFIRTRLLAINSPASGAACGADSGYNSQEDVEPEGVIINTIKIRMRCLWDENKDLKCQLKQVEQDVETFKSTASSCGHILKEVASTISSMLRKDINCDYPGDEPSKVNPLQEALATLNCDLSEKDTHISDLTKIKEELERQLQFCKSTNIALHHESSAKDQTICDLQETIEFQNSSLKLLQDIKEQLECDLSTVRQAIMRMERIMVRLRDENLAVKELLVDYENDYCHLEQKYLSITEMIDQQKQENFCIQGKLREKETVLEGLQTKYQATMQLICSVKARCRCGAAQTLKLDGKDLNLPSSKRPQDLQHIFEMLDRKNEELNAIKEYTSEEKNRLTKSILDLEDQVKQMQIKISVLEKSLCKREEELQIANEQLCSYADPDEENLLKSTIEKLTKDLKDANAVRREREACLMGEIAAVRKNLDEQSKALARSNETIANLERQTHGYRKQGDAVNKEVRERAPAG